MIEEPAANKTPQKSWLQRLKDESWEAELLVSTVSIYGTFQLFDFITWITNRFIDLLAPPQYIVAYMVVYIGLLAVSILVSMFVIHFFLRAYWVGLVGLNSVFPDYSLEDSAYSKIYTEKIVATLPKLKDSIEKVDELCSVIFSAAFTFLLLYMYMGLVTGLYLLLYNALKAYVPHEILLIPAAIIVIAFFFQAMLTMVANLKRNHEKERLQTVYFHTVRWVSMLAFGPMYKSIYQVFMIFGSNFKKKKSLVYLIMSFVLAGITLSQIQIHDTNIFYMVAAGVGSENVNDGLIYYEDDNQENDFLLAPEVDSDRIQASFMQLFVPVYTYELALRKEVCYTPASEADSSRTASKRSRTLGCYNFYNQVYLDGNRVDVDFSRNDHFRTGQFGLQTYIDLKGMERGRHELTIRKDLPLKNTLEWTIPFYYLPD